MSGQSCTFPCPRWDTVIKAGARELADMERRAIAAEGKLDACETQIGKLHDLLHDKNDEIVSLHGEVTTLASRLISCENEVSVRTDERDGAISLLRQAEERNKELESRLGAISKLIETPIAYRELVEQIDRIVTGDAVVERQ